MRDRKPILSTGTKETVCQILNQMEIEM